MKRTYDLALDRWVDLEAIDPDAKPYPMPPEVIEEKARAKARYDHRQRYANPEEDTPMDTPNAKSLERRIVEALEAIAETLARIDANLDPIRRPI